MTIIDEIIDWYKLSPDSCSSEDLVSPYDELIEDWKDLVPQNWYGFDLPQIPSTWIDVINDILVYCANTFDNFEIHQVKVKYGYLNIYLGNIPAEFQCELDTKLSGVMFDNRLIY